MISELDVNSKYIDEIEKDFFYVFKNEKIIDRLLNNEFTKYFVLIENDDLVGFINFDVIYDRAELIDLNIKEEYQNKGYASKLLEFMIDYLSSKKISNITLEVRNNNYNAIHLYKKYNFNEIALRKGYYNGIDALLMERKMM